MKSIIARIESLRVAKVHIGPSGPHNGLNIRRVTTVERQQQQLALVGAPLMSLLAPPPPLLAVQSLRSLGSHFLQHLQWARARPRVWCRALRRQLIPVWIRARVGARARAQAVAWPRDRLQWKLQAQVPLQSQALLLSMASEESQQLQSTLFRCFQLKLPQLIQQSQLNAA